MNNNNSNKELFEKINKIIEEKKNVRTPLIEILREVQENFGYLPQEALEFVSEKLGISISEIFGVATFYNLFSLTPKGKNVISVCLGTACYVNGAEKLVTNLEEILGIKMGETTKDNQFTLESLRCVGACSLAPVIFINKNVHAKLKSKVQLIEIIKKYQ